MKTITETDFKELLRQDGWVHEQDFDVYYPASAAEADCDDEIEAWILRRSRLGDIRIVHEASLLFLKRDGTLLSRLDPEMVAGDRPFETKIEGVLVVDETGCPSSVQAWELPEAFTRVDFPIDYARIAAEGRGHSL